MRNYSKVILLFVRNDFSLLSVFVKARYIYVNINIICNTVRSMMESIRSLLSLPGWNYMTHRQALQRFADVGQVSLHKNKTNLPT